MELLLSNWKLSPPGDSIYDGDYVSLPDFNDDEWCSVTVPGTLVGQLHEAGLYDDPYYGTNMKELPGYKHGRETHFAFHPMPQDSPFRRSFWYRTTFEAGEDKSREQRYFLKFDGINYKADIWINGKRVASSTFVAGTYRRYEIEVTKWIKRYKTNIIAVELWAQKPDELGMTFIDWSPVPPDDSAGLWQPVTLVTTGEGRIEHPFVEATLAEDHSSADLKIKSTISNGIREAFEGALEIAIGDVVISQEIHLDTYESREVVFTPDAFNDLRISNPLVWWPHDMGDQPLYDALFTLKSNDGEIHHVETVTFGIRSITSRINEHGARQFTVNGKDILIRGTAWSPNLLLDQSDRNDEIDVAYLKEMNFNTVRFEGKFATDYFWELCDREGILVIAGWPCCTHWEMWDKWKPDDYVVAEHSLRDQLRRLRNHASFAAWSYGSDYPPIPPVETMYLKVLDETMPQLVHLSSAAAFESKVTGPTGVKMCGPYGYVPPIYWYDENMPGIGKSFNTECGPDSSFPRLDTIRRMLPEDECYVGSKTWNHHAGLASFPDTEVVNDALERRYGVKRENLPEFLRTAQWNAYEAWRAMYEAYNRFFPEGTGVIGWMMNGHWPSLIWQKYDYWKVPTGGFYGAQVACEPVHVQYSYDDNSIWVVNNSTEAISGDVKVELYDANSECMETMVQGVTLQSYERKSAVSVSLKAEGIQFLFLTLLDDSGEELSRNIYWLSGKKDKLFGESTKKTWFYRPMTETADFSSLQDLPQTTVSVETEIHVEEEWRTVSLCLTNSGEKIAFAGQLDIIGEDGHLVAPVFWSENLVTLLPGEVREVTAQVMNVDYEGEISIAVNYINGETELRN